VRVQLWYFPAVIAVGHEDVSWPTVGVDYHDKVEVGVISYPIFSKCEYWV
jgi:hypothetical protein